jgi:hypothetical protein
VCVLLAINALPLNTDATAVQYTTYLIKFAEYVGKIVDDGSIYADRECFTDENTAGFLLKLMHPTGHTGRVTLSSIAMNNNVGSVEKILKVFLVILAKMIVLLEQLH